MVQVGRNPNWLETDQMAIFKTQEQAVIELPRASVWKRGLDRSYENEFELHENEPLGRVYFHTNGFARKLEREAKANLQMTF